MVRRTKEEAEETRSLLLDTAEQVFLDKGVARTSLGDIAQAAGLTRGAIYWHFKNKVDLFNAMLERARLPMEDNCDIPAPADEEPFVRIRRQALDVLATTETNPHARRVFEIVIHKCEMVDEMAAARERHQECRNHCLAEMESQFKRAVRLGHMPKTLSARRAAIGLFALVDGLISNWVLDPEQFSLRRDGERIVDAYLNGLRHDC
jgi:TetR/AcrR family acrAB operon transcriptional repressor